MSLSSMRTNPSIEEPSNIILLSNTFSTCDTGTSTFLIVPIISVNIKRKNRTFSSLIIALISSTAYVVFAMIHLPFFKFQCLIQFWPSLMIGIGLVQPTLKQNFVIKNTSYIIIGQCLFMFDSLFFFFFHLIDTFDASHI